MAPANVFGLFSIFIVIIVIILINCTIYGKFMNDLFEPTTFYMIFLVVFFGINYLSEYEYSWSTIVIVFIGSIFFLIGYYFKFRLSFGKRNSKVKKLYLENAIQKIGVSKYLIRTIIISLLNITIKIIEMQGYGISLSSFLHNMMYFAALSKKGGYVWLGLTYPLLVLNYINMIAYLKNEKKKFFVIILGQILFSVGILSTSRFTYIVNVVLVPLMIKQVYVDKKPSFKMYYLVILLLILPAMIILNYIRHGQYELISFSISSLIQNMADSLSGDTNPGQKFDALVRYLEQTGNYNYGKYFIYQVISVVPRKIWGSKPVTSFCYQYTMDVFGMDPISGGTTYTFTIFDTYSVGGMIPCCICQVIFGKVSSFLYRNVYRGSVFVQIFAIVVITNYINILRGSWMDVISIYFLYIVVNVIFHFCFQKMRRRKSVALIVY